MMSQQKTYLHIILASDNELTSQFLSYFLPMSLYMAIIILEAKWTS